jgi:hypothetical protein
MDAAPMRAMTEPRLRQLQEIGLRENPESQPRGGGKARFSSSALPVCNIQFSAPTLRRLESEATIVLCHIRVRLIRSATAWRITAV